MACAACSANVERKLKGLPGVHSATVSLVGRSALVEFNPAEISLEKMKQAINDIGYDLVIENDRSVVEIERREYRLLMKKTLISWCFAILCMSISMGWLSIGSATVSRQTALLLALGNAIYCGRNFYVSAWRQLHHLTANMDTLVALSTSIAFLFSVFNTFFGEAVWGAQGIEWHTYYDASVMIITFVLTGRLLEEKAKNGTADSIRQLMGLSPKTAHLVETDGITDVPVATVKIGDILEVRAGEKVPVDGEVTLAESFMNAVGAYVDESMITGEPTPALKEKGSQALAGTIVSQGSFRFRARQIGENTALAHIVKMVQEAQGSKAPVQRTVDRLALIFVPTVIGISVLTFLLWWAIGGQVALPQAVLCAVSVLVIACPCAMGLATPTALMVSIGRAAQDNVLIKDATALESLRRIDAMVIDKTGTLTIPNKNVDFTKADGLPLETRETLKPHATEAVAALIGDGIELYMMSGDKEEAAHYWAEKAGIQHYRSKVLPRDKEQLVRRLQTEGHCVAMVGDGINDTQALALADVSIAMGKGTDVAMDVAQVTLMSDDLRKIPRTIRLSRHTVSMIRQNLFWAFVYNVVCIPLAAGLPYVFGFPFHIGPMFAGGLMAFSSVSVVLNSLRLKYWK